MAAALQAPVPPRTVGRYVLYGEIASGGMATVHFGRLIGPAGFARPVAIKRLHAQFARDPDFVKMFFDEARLAARIAHPNVVPMLDVVSSDDEVFLVMEYVRGASLAQLVRALRRNDERMQPLVGVGIVSGMLQGLHAAHEAKSDRGERLDLVHRDVSPQNVLVGTDGIARLLDFGVAKASGRLQTTRDGQLKGKLAYMAPEQVRGEPLTRRTDIYAASVVLWEALTGQRLFYAENEATVLSRVISAEVPPPSSIVPELPLALDRVVLRGLERDPAKRYATAREMAADLDTCIGVASPSEIGDWVERTAADDLRERATHIAEIERTAAEAADSTALVSSFPGTGAPDAPTPVGRRSPDTSTNVWSQSETTRNVRFRPERSQVSSVSLAGVTEPAYPRRRIASVIVALSAVAAIVLFLVASRAPHRGKGVALAGSLAGSAAPSAPPPLASALSLPAPTSSAEALPSASASAAPVSPAGVLPSAPPVPAAGAPSAAVLSKAPRKASTQRRNVAPVDNPECSPPYTADAKGHIHFKPSCI